MKRASNFEKGNLEPQKGKRTGGYPARTCFLSFPNQKNISHFESEDSS